MLKYMRHHGEKGQTIILLAFAMIGLLAIVGLALDGGMLYWNQRRAQNGADAAVIAGVTAMAEHTLLEGGCGLGSEQGILNQVWEYADVNEVPNAEAGDNIVAYYLVENSSGDRVDLMDGGERWYVGKTGSIPCDREPVGLRVEASFPQQTFLAHVIGIAETNVTVEASAIVDNRKGCGDFVLLGLGDDPNGEVVKVTGSDLAIKKGGMHSNGGFKIEGSTGHPVYLEPGKPIECSNDSPANKCELKDGKVEGGPDSTAPNMGAGGADAVQMGGTFYRFIDFDEGGYIYDEVDASHRYVIDGNLNNEAQIRDASGNLKPGLYVVHGDVKFNNIDKEERPWRVTIAATGNIEISGGFDARPYARGVLFFTESDNMANGAINVSGDASRWAGLIAAPNGLVSFSGSNNTDLAGMIVGYNISLTGSTTSVRHHPKICPPDPPKVLLVQ